MKKVKYGILIAFLFIVLAGVIITPTGLINDLYAATTQDVTVTATPEYVSISNSPSTWTLNGITGSGVIQVDTIYYSNPLGDTTAPSATVVDGECRFTITNSSTVAIDLTVTCGAFAGGDANMTNSDTGANGATTYGSYCWYSGMTYASKVIVKSSGSGVMYNELAALTDIKWGAEIETRTDAWTGGSSSTATMTISATVD